MVMFLYYKHFYRIQACFCLLKFIAHVYVSFDVVFISVFDISSSITADQI